MTHVVGCLRDMSMISTDTVLAFIRVTAASEDDGQLRGWIQAMAEKLADIWDGSLSGYGQREKASNEALCFVSISTVHVARPRAHMHDVILLPICVQLAAAVRRGSPPP
jgi:hypothetical protein